MDIVSKGETFNLDIASKQSAPAGTRKFYFGAGWDNPNGPADLDMVCSMLVDGKLVDDEQFVYFGSRDKHIENFQGVFLSKDNQTGDGDGDDEHITVNTDALPSKVNGLSIGLVCYTENLDFSNATNPHFRVCDGDTEDSPQIADVKIDSGAAGDTVLVGFNLKKSDDGWLLTNDGSFYAKGNLADAVRGFANLSK